MSEKHGVGIHAWMLSIRQSMANDPCRQLFEDQVQTHAFLFLDDYLESIIAGPQQAPIIDLVKTPGRKKNVPRRTKTASKDVAKRLEFEPVPQDQDQVSPLEVPILGHSNDLSVIAEGDESPERSYAPIAAPPPFTTQSGISIETHSQSRETSPIFQANVRDTINSGPHTEEEPVPEMDNVTSPSSANTFCSIALETPDQPRSPHVRTGHDEHSLPHLASSPPPTLPKDPFITSGTILPISETSSLLDTMVVPLNDSELQNNPSKSNVSQFPTLPAPSPLRKSIRVPTETTNNALPFTTPAPPPIGKRTSWLSKAREAKAMEGGVTRPSTFNNVPLESCTPDAGAMPTSSKRKSSEMLGNLPQSRTGEKKRKIPKTTQPDTTPLTTVEMDQERTSDMSIRLPVVGHASKPFESHDVANRHPVSLNEGEEGFIRQFKRTVEGFGARTCKSTAKPLGDAAAALAEARAAAEARVAKRNKVNDEVHNSENATEPSSMQLPQPPQGEPHNIGSRQRLSVSDLAGGTQEPNNNIATEILQVPSVQSHTVEDQPRTSTTPANSPPHRNAGFVKPMGPVFTKQPISTTLAHTKPPAPASHPKEFSFDFPASTLTLPAPMSFDASTRLMSLHSNLRKGLEDGEKAPESIVTSHAPDIVEPDDLSIHEQDSIDSLDLEDSRMDTGELGPPSTATTVKATSIVRSSSQLSGMSTASSSQSEIGFFGQATRLVTNMLGGGKKAKPEVKSLQLAAAAAKKQQGEADKKALRLKEMEARRQAAVARKLEEERLRVLEEEKRVKDETERRKRDREENTDKRPLKLPATAAKKVEEDTTKKRKIAVDIEKKAEAKKPVSKDQKDHVPVKPIKSSTTTPATKIAPPPKSIKSTATALVSSTAYNATQNGSSSAKPAAPEPKPFKLASASPKGKGKARPQDDGGDKLPSAMIQTQMAARAKAQIEASKQQVPEIPSESIELPDINSEYSDSEDEDRVRTFDPPDWAQSPELRHALQMQSTVNPDDVFGAIRPLRMEEIFRTRQSRFRARTSSANWSGADRLTVEEIREYERRMGFQSRAS